MVPRFKSVYPLWKWYIFYLRYLKITQKKTVKFNSWAVCDARTSCFAMLRSWVWTQGETPLFFLLFFQFLIFSSPELKAHKVSLQYTNGLSSSTLSNLNTSKSQLASLDQILCFALLGWGKGCIRFWGRLEQNSLSMATESCHRPIMGKTMSLAFLRCYWSNPFYTSGNKDMH